MTEEESGRPWFAGDHPRRIHFFVPLQDSLHLSVDKGSDFIRQADLSIGTVGDASPFLIEPPDPDVDLAAPVYPAIRVIFHRVPGRQLDLTPIVRTAEVVQRRLGVGEDELAQRREEFMSAGNDSATATGWWTVAEMVFEDYGLVPEHAAQQRAGEMPDWFMLCLEALNELVRGYRIATKSPVAEVTYSRLPPVMFTLVVPWSDGDFAGPVDAAYWTLSSGGQTWVEVEPDADLPADEIGAYTARAAQRISVNDPLLTYTDRMWRARRALEFEGEFDSAVLHAAIAVEAELTAIWMYLQWEKGVPATAALGKASTLGGKKPTKTVLSWLAQDLGGVWLADKNERMRAWTDYLMPLRNRIAHAGVRASRAEAELAIAVAEGVERYVAERLEERWPDYPRTGVLAIGHARLRQRWGNARVDAFFEETQHESFYAMAYSEWLRSASTS